MSRERDEEIEIRKYWMKSSVIENTCNTSSYT